MLLGFNNSGFLLLDFYSEKDAQMCIYDASLETHFGFCCDIDEAASRELARMSFFFFFFFFVTFYYDFTIAE